MFECDFPADPTSLRPIRHEVDRYLTEFAPGSDHASILLVVSELCTNAIEASGAHHGTITLRLRREGETMAVEVDDDGPGFEMRTTSVARSDDQERGRGLGVVKALADEVVVTRVAQWTRVRAVTRL